ncbi:MAG: cupredoxin domain-containing protein [Elusimicrobia bacterium]|nr:cupredoxin domain-containing protein [Elusimicrobiota bacterium]
MTKWVAALCCAAFVGFSGYRPAHSQKAEEKAGSVPKTEAEQRPVREFTLLNIEFEGSKIWVPGTLLVKKGEHVKINLINNAPSGAHGFAIDEFGIKVVVENKKKETVEFDAVKEGLINFYCHLHVAHIGGQILIMK